MSAPSGAKTLGQSLGAWRFPYPVFLQGVLVLIALFGGVQAWSIHRSLGSLLRQAQGQGAALPERVMWMVVGLWVLVGVMVVFVGGALLYRARLRLVLGEGHLRVASLFGGERRIKDEDVSRIEVYGSIWQGLRLRITHRGGEEGFPLLHARGEGAGIGEGFARVRAPENVKQHPLVNALMVRFGESLVTVRVRR